MCEKHFVPKNPSPKSSIAHTNSLWSIYQPYTNDDVNNNNNDITESRNLLHEDSRLVDNVKMTGRDCSKIVSDLSVAFSNPQDHDVINRKESTIASDNGNDDSVLTDCYTNVKGRNSQKKILDLNAPRDEGFDLHGHDTVTNNDDDDDGNNHNIGSYTEMNKSGSSREASDFDVSRFSKPQDGVSSNKEHHHNSNNTNSDDDYTLTHSYAKMDSSESLRKVSDFSASRDEFYYPDDVITKKDRYCGSAVTNSDGGNDDVLTEFYTKVEITEYFNESSDYGASCHKFSNFHAYAITNKEDIYESNVTNNNSSLTDFYTEKKITQSPDSVAPGNEFSNQQYDAVTKKDNNDDVITVQYVDSCPEGDKVAPEGFLYDVKPCQEFSGMREKRSCSFVGDEFHARPVRKRCNSYVEYSDYEESNALFDAAASTLSYDVSESNKESHADQGDDIDVLTAIAALSSLSKEEVVRDSTAILLRLYEENQSLRDQCTSHDKLFLENTEMIKQLRYDLSRKARLLKDLCMELEEKTSHLPDSQTENMPRCQLRERILQLEDENEAYKMANETLQSENGDLLKREECYQQHIQQLQDEVSVSREDLRKHTDEQETRQNTDKQLHASVKDLEIVIRHLTFENLELSETVQSLKDSGNKKKEEELRKVQDRCDELQEQLTKAHEDQRRTPNNCPNNSDNSNCSCKSNNSILSEITRTIPTSSDLPPHVVPMRKRTRSYCPQRQTRPVVLRRRAASMSQKQTTSFQIAQQADRASLPTLTSLLSGTTILNRVGPLVAGLAALGTVSLAEPTGLVVESSLELGKPGTPGSGDLEAALTRLSIRSTDAPKGVPLTVISVDKTSALKPTSSWESSPKVAGLETYALSTAPLTVSVFTYMTSLTKPVCSVTSLTNKSYSVTSGSGMNIVSCLESGCSKNTPSVVERASSNFAPFTTVRGVTSLPNILLDSSLPSSNFQQVNMTSSVPTFVRPQTTLFGNAVRGEHCSKWPDASDVTTVMSRQTPKSTSSIKLSPCSSILNAMTSLR